jgi:hypothetical protein
LLWLRSPKSSFIKINQKINGRHWASHLGYRYKIGCFIHSVALQILNLKIYTTRMHPFRSVNMFFPQFMQTQSFRFDQPNREWMLLKHTLTAFNGRIAQLVCTQMFWC